MKHKRKLTLAGIAALVCLLTLACAPSKEERSLHNSIKKDLEDTVISTNPEATAQGVLEQSFARSADLKFSVKDVRRASNQIEHFARKVGGFICSAHLSGNKSISETVQVSKDSIMEITTVTYVNDIILNVPNQHLDTVLQQINNLVEFMDNKTIKAEDLKQQLVAAKLNYKNSQYFITNINQAVQQQGKKLPQTIEAIEKLNEEKIKQANGVIDELNLMNSIEFSTIRLSIYQPGVAQVSERGVPLSANAYSPSFTDEIKRAWSKGLEIVEALLVLLIAIWPFVLFVCLGVYVFKKIRVKFPKFFGKQFVK